MTDSVTANGLMISGSSFRSFVLKVLEGSECLPIYMSASGSESFLINISFSIDGYVVSSLQFCRKYSFVLMDRNRRKVKDTS